MSTRIQMLIAAAAATVIAAAIIVAVVLAQSDDPAPPSGDGEEPTPASQDIAWACTLLNEMPDPLTKDDLALAEPALHRAAAAGALVTAAALAGDSWSDLHDTGTDLVSAAAKLDSEQIIDSVAALREPCADVSTEPFESDIALSCEVIDAAPDDLGTAAGDDPFDSPVLWELHGAGLLGLAVEFGDDSAPEQFTTPSKNLVTAVNTLDTPRMAEAVSNLRTFCADAD